MTGARGNLRIPLLGLAIVALLIAVAIPALAASPSGAPAAAASEHPGKGPKASKEPKEPEVPVTLSGVVAATTDADGETAYTMSVAGKTVRLEAGPSWFFGDKHPLKPFVGKTVTVTGEQSGDEVDVETVDGVRLRAEGKPPWAGGWKAVGSAHPGWSQEKADRWQQKQADKAARGAGGAAGAAGAGCWPPGHCKDHGPEASAEAPDPNGG